MSHSKQKIKTEFSLEGRFLNFVYKDGIQIKYLKLATAHAEYWIKPSKELQHSLPEAIAPGAWIKVSGTRKVDLKKGIVKLKAETVELSTPGVVDSTLAVVAPQAPSAPARQTILVCQKSDCCKRGGRAVQSALHDALKQQDLADRVAIKGTGCMKRCKAGPNIVMPDKTRYSRISPDVIPELVEKHCQPASVLL